MRHFFADNACANSVLQRQGCASLCPNGENPTLPLSFPTLISWKMQFIDWKRDTFCTSGNRAFSSEGCTSYWVNSSIRRCSIDDTGAVLRYSPSVAVWWLRRKWRFTLYLSMSRKWPPWPNSQICMVPLLWYLSILWAYRWLGGEQYVSALSCNYLPELFHRLFMYITRKWGSQSGLSAWSNIIHSW